MPKPKKNIPKSYFDLWYLECFLKPFGNSINRDRDSKKKIQLTTAVIVAISNYLENYDAKWLLPFFSLAIAFGALGGLSNWLVGISKGLHHATEAAIHSPALSKVNRHGVPVTIMLLQGIIVSILSFIFIAMPSISSAFWLLLVLSSQLYLITYALMFISCMILRFKKPHVFRGYQISEGKTGTLIVGGTGLLATIFAFFMGFVPPSQMEMGNIFFYDGFLILGLILSTSIPFLILRKSTQAVTT